MYLLLADDLTGACDTGIAFTQAGISVDVILSGPSFSCLNMPEAPQMLAINTCTRNARPAEAAEAVSTLSRMLAASLAPELVYKKIDSTMRGPIAAEIASLMSSLKIDLAFITPAAPLLGRTVRDGHLFVNGQLLHETIFAQDPLSPVFSSDLLEILENSGQIALIPVAIIDSGQAAILDEIGAQVEHGCRWFVFDSLSPAHLETIAKVGLSLRPTPLFAGSAGLARALAPLLPGEYQTEPAGNSGPTFFISGSAHEATHKQIRRLAETGVEVFYLPDNSNFSGVSQRLEQKIKASLQKGSCVLAAPVQRLASQEEAAAVSARVSEVALAVLALLPASFPLRLCICGGETAFFTLSHLAEIIRLLRELEPGVAESELLDGNKKELTVITKAGGFGDEETLVRINEG